MKIDEPRIAKAVREILEAIGEDPNRDGLIETPQRVARLYSEICSGLTEDPKEHIDKSFAVDHDEIIIVRDVPFYSICEHHLLPFFGKAHLGYLPQPGSKITGLSKLARLVDGYSRRPQVQERLTMQVASAIQTRLDSLGAIVVLEAEHLCMSMRGIKKPGTTTLTSSVCGIFREDASSRAEAMDLIFRKS